MTGLAFAGRGTAFHRRVVTIAAGASRPYDTAEWAGALVIVERGPVDLEGVSGSRRRLGEGAVLWLCGLPLRALHNPARTPAVLVALTRRPDEGETGR